MAKIKYEGSQKQNVKKRTMHVVDDDEDEEQPVYPIEEEYNVEYLYGKKFENGQIKYCVKWENYTFEESSFEPVENLENVVYNMRGFERKMSDLIFRVALLQNAKKKLPPFQVNPIQLIQKDNIENTKEQIEPSQAQNHLQKEPSVINNQTSVEKFQSAPQQSPKKINGGISDNQITQNQQSLIETNLNSNNNCQIQGSPKLAENLEKPQNGSQNLAEKNYLKTNGNSNNQLQHNHNNQQQNNGNQLLNLNQSLNLLQSNGQHQSQQKQSSNGNNQNSQNKQSLSYNLNGNGQHQKKVENQAIGQVNSISQVQNKQTQLYEKNRRTNSQDQYIQTKLDQNLSYISQKQLPKPIEDNKTMEVVQTKNKSQLQFRDPVLENELNSNAYSAQVVVDDTSKYGNFNNGDIPLKILKHAPYTRIQKVIGNNVDLPSSLYFKVIFKPRPSGTVPQPAYIAFNELKDRYPRVLMEYYEQHAILLDPVPDQAELQLQKTNSRDLNVKNDASLISNAGNNKKMVNGKENRINI
ncbi:hypothetical protein TTHERM_00086720 (macronuclear) [Tetrahymena thermophila SB210]|uniref:Chromo domain-containing protein n=1 Tax=Tetrahymena thermophila (strain SB210) TaxID=312017 RepID=Q236M5_TETTS|nr:hypothetical protein TTHERM_00086720 [Tetrahymena thermophila SB210]EAR92475.1 hypothetical protein TTHERM_00086720 [Tetrahymena thermophila SB210]|eukprot:XP_001012720.1 hypothetical protein TTHERM_00086720 [Tetrahymena thermophila SB210]